VDEAGISVKMVEERRGDIRQEESAAQGVEQSQAPASGVPHLLHDAELAALKKKLEGALEEENYEEAARLRDRIRELESS
jgi:protein-arginine kinase activator protein McsA